MDANADKSGAAGKQVTIYALCDEEGVRYIGQTTWPLERRLASHIVDSYSQAKMAWLRGLEARGQKPRIVALEVTTPEHADEAERRQIAEHLERGCALVNARPKAMVRKQQRLDPDNAVRVSVRMPTALHAAVMQMSEEEQRSLNAQVVWCVQHCVARWTKDRRGHGRTGDDLRAVRS